MCSSHMPGEQDVLLTLHPGFLGRAALPGARAQPCQDMELHPEQPTEHRFHLRDPQHLLTLTPGGKKHLQSKAESLSCFLMNSSS